MTKEDNENFKDSTKCWICDNDYSDNDVKVRYHFHITGKYRGSEHRYCNISLKFNQKLSVVFYNLKNCDSHFIRKTIKFNLKINAIPNGLEKDMIFTINNKLGFIGS